MLIVCAWCRVGSSGSYQLGNGVAASPSISNGQPLVAVAVPTGVTAFTRVSAGNGFTLGVVKSESPSPPRPSPRPPSPPLAPSTLFAWGAPVSPLPKGVPARLCPGLGVGCNLGGGRTHDEDAGRRARAHADGWWLPAVGCRGGHARARKMCEPSPPLAVLAGCLGSRRSCVERARDI